MIDFKKEHQVIIPATKILEMIESQRNQVDLQQKHLDVLGEIVSIIYDLDREEKAKKTIKMKITR